MRFYFEAFVVGIACSLLAALICMVALFEWANARLALETADETHIRIVSVSTTPVVVFAGLGFVVGVWLVARRGRS